jgi:hypothetical protein
MPASVPVRVYLVSSGSPIVLYAGVEVVNTSPLEYEVVEVR